MRSIIYKALTEDAQLLEDIPKGRWLENSAGLDVPEPPFAVLTWGDRNGPMHALATRGLSLYVHDARGDYSIIDRVLARAEEVILAQIDVTQGNSRVSEASWIFTSGDLDDQEYRTNMRYTEFRIAGR